MACTYPKRGSVSSREACGVTVGRTRLPTDLFPRVEPQKPFLHGSQVHPGMASSA